MKVKEKNAQKKVQREKRYEVINISADDQEIPSSIKIDDNLFIILCQPHRFYKVQGVDKLIYKGSQLVVDGLNDPKGQAIQRGECVIEISQTEKEKSQIFEELLNAFKSSGSDNSKQLNTIKRYLSQAIPLLVLSKNLNIQYTSPPWPQKISEVIMKAIKFSNKTRILITGNKNTGKSTLCNFMVDQLASKQSVCLIDLDIGKGRGLPGSISLYRCSPNKNPQIISYWIGEYSPLNYSNLYIESVKRLVQIHRSRYFNDPLIINTMGYLTGFGELVLLEIYNIVQPSELIFLSKNEDRKQYLSLKDQLEKSDIKRRSILGVEEESIKFQSNFNFLINPHAGIKGAASKSKSFEESLGITSFEELLSLKLRPLKFLDILIQTKNGQILKKEFNPSYTDLQLLIFCDRQSGNTYLLKGIGYGFNGKIFGQVGGQVCIKSEIAQFEKQFYNLNEKQLISLEQTLESELPYILPNYKGLATMGYRNLSSKKHRT